MERLTDEDLLLAQASAVAKIGGWQLCLRTNTPTWSTETYRIHEVKLGEPVALDQALSYYHADDQPIIREAVERCAREHRPFELQLRVITRSGSLKWVLVKGEPVFENGRVDRLRGLFQDITRQRELELEQERLTRRFQRVSDNNPGLVFQFAQAAGGQVVFTHLGGRLAGSLGLTLENLNGLPDLFYRSVQSGDRWGLLRHLVRSLRAGDLLEWSGRILDPNGIVRWVFVRAAPEKSTTGEIIWDGLLVDTTDLVEAHRKLGETRNMLNTFGELIPAAVFTKNEDRRYTMVNRYFTQTLPKDSAGCLGRTDGEIFGPAFAEVCKVSDDEIFHHGRAGEFVEEHRGPDQRPLAFRVYKFPLRDSSGKITGLAGVAWDISDHRQLEMDLDNERNKLFQAAKFAELGELAAALAHEINNPLAIIQGFAMQLRRLIHDNAEPEAVLRAVEKIDQTTQRVARIVRSLRVFARDGQQDAHATLSVTSLIETVKGLCQDKLNAHGIDLIVEDCDPDLRVRGQETQLAQVFVNLINNSFDAIESLHRKWIKIGVAASERSVVFSVTDSGHGIPENIRDKVMQPFFTSKPVGKGTGLGLSIARGIIESHGGELVLDTSSSHTRFVFGITPHTDNLNTTKTADLSAHRH